MGTQFQASKAVQDTFGLHLGGAQWMTFANTLSKVVHWDFVSLLFQFLHIHKLTCYAERHRPHDYLPRRTRPVRIYSGLT